MSDETRDVEALADWLGGQVEASNVFDITDEATTWIEIQVEDLAERILASDWLAEHDAEVEARVREQVAQAIEADRPNWSAHGAAILDAAARIARGGAQ